MPAEVVEDILAEIKLFIEYAVPEKDRDNAMELVLKYKNDPMFLKLFHEHYSTLPGDLEEAVCQVFSLKHKQGVHLLVLSSSSLSSIYLVSPDNIVWLGECGSELDSNVLEYFEYKSQQDYFKDCQALDTQGGDGSNSLAMIERCPVCSVYAGEFHVFGCVVEVCPWCEGQLNKCNCRFEQLKTDEIVDEEQVEEFYDLVSAKGRIAFAKDQVPAYPGTSDGLDVKKE